MDTSTTIIFCTDNSCPKDIFEVVVNRLRKVDLPIISVSHKPLDLGTNICIGKHKRSWLTLYKQISLGLQAATTPNIHIAEHDCLYSEEHWAWRPPKDNIFYYNENVCLVEWSKGNEELNGMYSRFWAQRLALSQLVCNRELYLRVLEKRLDIIDKDRSLIKAIEHIGEPGVSRVKKARHWADSGRPVYLKEFLGRVLELEKYETFATEIPNLDVRHDKNFTGPRRGRKRCYELPYWGKFEELVVHENRT